MSLRAEVLEGLLGETFFGTAVDTVDAGLLVLSVFCASSAATGA